MAKIKDIHEAYEEGLEGWQDDPRGMDQFWAGQQDPTFADCCDHLQGIGAGKRVMLWRSREKYDPGALSKESQTTGDCVSHGSRTARDTTRSVEVHIKGEAEEYYKRGATEPTYGSRGHGGQGMSPAVASKFERDVGFLFREDYPGVVNLTRYNSSIGDRWGRSGVPGKVKELCKKYNVGRYILPREASECMDLMAAGYAGHSGQSWGTSASPGSDGINRKTASWNHDMATVGYDDTQEIWKETVFFVPNSWGAWNRRNPKWDESVLGPWIPGMIVVGIGDYARYFVGSGSIMFYADIKSVPAKPLPDWGFNY